MAWQEVTPILTGAAGKGTVTYSCNPKRGGSRLTITSLVVDVLKWKPGASLKLFVGAGELEGKLRLVPDRAGIIAAQKVAGPGKGGLWIRLGKMIPGLPDREVGKVKVEHQVDGEALVVTLPRHALMTVPEPRPAPPPASVAVRATPLPTPVAAKREVTSRFFDDPKPANVAMGAGTRGAR